MFGIDTASTITPDVIERVESAYGTLHFIGRYLPYDAVTIAEVNLILGRGIAVLPLWNGETAATVALGYSYGVARGMLAATRWKGMGVPDGCAVYCDVEQPWAPSADFLRGYMDGCHDLGMVAGFYLNPQYGNNHSAAYRAARGATKSSAVVFTSENELNDTPVSTFVLGPTGAQPVTGYEDDTAVHQTWENALAGLVDLDCASDNGYSLMYGARAPRNLVSVLGQRLKSLPNHVSPAVSAPLEVGVEVVFSKSPTGRIVTPHWGHVEVKNGAAQGKSGWLMRDVLQLTY